MSKIKIEYVAIIGLLIYVLTLQECSINPFYDTTPGIDTLSYTTDTIRIHSVDTIELPGTVRYITLTIPVPVHDTIFIGDSIVIDSLNTYTTDISDSLITGSITSRVDGVLVSQSLNYTPMFPKYIIRTDSIIIDNTLTLEKKKNHYFLGGEVGGNSNVFNLSPVIGMSSKKGYNYSYRYGLVDKTHNFTISKVIW